MYRTRRTLLRLLYPKIFRLFHIQLWRVMKEARFRCIWGNQRRMNQWSTISLIAYQFTFSTQLFSPLKTELEVVDVSIVTATLAELRKTEKKEFAFVVGGQIIDTGRDPDEIIMICFDRSSSMGGTPDFPDTQSVGGSRSELSRVCHKYQRSC
jgi:hypothetical protein